MDSPTIMAKDPLDSVITNVPDWLTRLEELNGQIEQRQQELAKFATTRPLSSAQSIRNRGSTESLRPQNDDDVPPQTPGPATDQALQTVTTPTAPQAPNGNHPNATQSPSTPASDPWTGSSLVRHTSELVATAQRRARATVRKRQKTDSMISTEGETPKYRTRRMVKVYYDSYVQSFFEELVKFVSSQRNLMRKAKMAAKVAQIRQLAELEIPDGEGDAGGVNDADGHSNAGNGCSTTADPTIPTPDPKQGAPSDMKLPYLSTRPYRGPLMNPAMNHVPRRGMTSALNGRLGAFNEKRDIWDEMDGGLEYVQGMCERAAHQFLRDGDCNEEVEKIKSRLGKVKELAVNEKERKTAESPKGTAQPEKNAVIEPNQDTVPESGHDAVLEPQNDAMPPTATPEGLSGTTEPTKSRTFRPSTMRRDFGASTPSKLPAQHGVLEIDEGIEVDMDDFKPVYRSTRLMRRPI